MWPIGADVNSLQRLESDTETVAENLIRLCVMSLTLAFASLNFCAAQCVDTYTSEQCTLKAFEDEPECSM